MKTNNLTIKQEDFCQAYIRLGDKSAAYRDAYSTSNMKATTIHKRSCELFDNGAVAGRIEELRAKVAVIAEKKFEITTTEMLRHLNILRNARIDEYVEFKEFTVSVFNKMGKKTGTTKEMRMEFKPFDRLTKEQLMCIESIKQTRHGIEIKLHGKDWTIEKINKHIGFYEKDNEQKNKVEISSPEERDARIAALKAKLKE